MVKTKFKNLALAVLVIGVLGVFAFGSSANAVSPSDYGLREGDLIRASGDNDIFIINEFGYKRLFLNPAIFNMYGHLGGWANVKTVSPAVRDAFQTSPYYRADGDTKVYRLALLGDDTGSLHWVNVSQSEFLSNANPNSIFTINGLELAWYPKGSDYTFAPTPTPVVGLSAKLASDNPASATLPKDANSVSFVRVDFTGTGDVKELKLKRTGLGDKSEFENVYLYADGVRITEGKTFNSDNQIEFKNLKLKAPVSVAVVADLDATSGNEHAITVVSVVSDSSVNGLPLAGNTFRISGAEVGSLTIANSGSLDNPVVGQNKAKVAEFKLSVPTDKENVSIKSVQLEQVGNADISGLRLAVDGKEYTGSINSDDEVLFSGLNIVIEDGKSKKFEVFADIDEDANAGETVSLDLVRPNDIYGVGDVYGYGVSVVDSFTAVSKTLVASGNLDVKAVSTSDQIAYFGQSVSNVAKFKFTAEESEGFYIEELNFDSGASLSANVESLSITYKNKSGSTLTKTESVDGVGSVSFDSFADADRPYVPADGSMELSVGFELTNDEDSSRFVDFKLVLDGYTAVGASSDEELDEVVDEEANNGLYTFAGYFTVKRESASGDLDPADDVEFSLTAHSDTATSAFLASPSYGSITLDVFHASGSVSFEDVGWTAYADGNEISSGTITSSGTLVITFDEDVELEDGDVLNVKVVFDGLEDFVYDDGDRFTLTLKDANGVIKWVDDFDGDNEANVQNVVDLDNSLPIKFIYKN